MSENLPLQLDSAKSLDLEIALQDAVTAVLNRKWLEFGGTHGEIGEQPLRMTAHFCLHRLAEAQFKLAHTARRSADDEWKGAEGTPADGVEKP
jgi:hypothetical protein